MTGTIIAVSCILGALIWGLLAGRKKKTPQTSLAEKLGLTFDPERNYRIPEHCSFLAEFEGTNRYICNRFIGTLQSIAIEAFDFCCESDGTKNTHCFIIDTESNDVLFTAPHSILTEDLEHLQSTLLKKDACNE